MPECLTCKHFLTPSKDILIARLKNEKLQFLCKKTNIAYPKE